MINYVSTFVIGNKTIKNKIFKSCILVIHYDQPINRRLWLVIPFLYKDAPNLANVGCETSLGCRFPSPNKRVSVHAVSRQTKRLPEGDTRSR